MTPNLNETKPPNSQLCETSFMQQPIKTLLTCQMMMSNYRYYFNRFQLTFQLDNVVYHQNEQNIKATDGLFDASEGDYPHRLHARLVTLTFFNVN